MSSPGSEWTAVDLPHDAMLDAPRSPAATAANAYFAGGVWQYRKSFELGEITAGSVVALAFEGVYRDAVIYVNDTVVGRRPSGYAEILVEISDFLDRGGANAVKVECRAHDDSRWYSGAGIYRNVWLLTAGSVHVEEQSLSITTPTIDDDVATVVVQAQVANRTGSPRGLVARVTLTGPDGSVAASADQPLSLPGLSTTPLYRRLYINGPERWTLDDPALYKCEVSLLDDGSELDTTSSSFGIRSVAVDPYRGFQLNGTAVNLRGACIHHDNGLLGAATFDRAEERRVELLKAAGFNAIRSAHNPTSRALLDACDRHGVLVMDETFDMWTHPKSEDDYSLRFTDWWERDCESMVLKDRNHPSVVLYSIGNEIPEIGSGAGLQWNRVLAAKIRSLDPTRLITAGISGLLVGGDELMAKLIGQVAPPSADETAEVAMPDEADGPKAEESRGVNSLMTDLGSIMAQLMLEPVLEPKLAEPMATHDVAGFNYMEIRFELDHANHPERVMVSTESHPSEIDRIWQTVSSMPSVIGDFTWTGWDYLGEVGIGRIEFTGVDETRQAAGYQGAFPWLAAFCGDLDITGRRRPQSYYREIVYGLRTDPYLAVRRPENIDRAVSHKTPWSWSDVIESWTWPNFEGSRTLVEVYADADEVELSLNGRSVGTKPCGAQQRYRTEFEVTIEPGVLTAVARRGDIEIGRTSLRSASPEVKLQLEADQRTIGASHGELAYVGVALVDDDGVVHIDLAKEIAVTLEGPGVLQGFGSASPMTLECFSSSSATTYEGRALAIIRPTGSGRLTVIAASPGLGTEALAIDVE